jgi:hypothetical protein
MLTSKSKSCYDRQSVLWPDIIFCLKVAVLSLWGALSMTRGRVCLLNAHSKSKSHYDQQSVGQFTLVSCPSWSRWPDVTFIWVMISFIIFHVGRPLWREDVPVICSAMTQVQFQVTLRPTVCRPVRLGAEDFNFFVWQLLRLPGVGLPHPYPPWTGWSSQKSKSR